MYEQSRELRKRVRSNYLTRAFALGGDESFSKRGSPRSDFQVGSIRSQAGVTKYRNITVVMDRSQ